MKLATHVVRATFFCLASLCLSALAQGQSLIVTPTQLTFNLPTGIANSSAQSVTIMPDMNTASASVSFSVNTVGNPWLRVNNTNSGLIQNVTQTGATLAVTVDTQGLVTGQTYNGFFTVQIPSVPSSQQVVNVSVVVGGTSALFAAPGSLSFSATQGSSVGTPTSQNVTVASTVGPLNFTLSSQTQPIGGNWLSISSTGGTAGATSGTFSVSVIPSGLISGTYTGTITAQSTTTADLVQIPVTLMVTAGSTITLTPSSVPPFLYQVGGTLPSPQSILVTSSGSPISFSVSQSPQTTSWLVVNPQSGTATSTGVPISLSLNQAGLPTATGTYTTNLVIAPSGSANLAPIPITLVVSNNPILTASPSSLTYMSSFAGPNPNDQVVNVTAMGGSAGFTVSSDSPWLSVSLSSNTTPSTLLVHVSTSGLAVGSYNGNLSLKPTNGDNYTIPIPVSLSIVNAPQVTAAPSTLLFSYETTQSPPTAQTFQVQSAGIPLQFTVTPSTTSCGSSWLAVAASQNVTPATVTVQVFTTGLAVGVCAGSVSVNFGTAASQPLIVPVTVAVSSSAELSIGQPTPFGNEVVTQGATGSQVITRTISLTSTDPNTPVMFNAFASSGGGWLTVGPGTGTTPQNLVVSIVPGGLPAGVYGGQVLISSTSFPGALTGQQFALPVTLTVNPNVTVAVTPASLSFIEAQGGSVPSNQSLTLASTGGTASFTATVNQITGGSWLAVSPTSGNANQALTVSIAANSLPASTTPYTAQIVLSFPNSSTPSITVPVSLTVTNPVSLAVSPSTLTFNYQAGGTQPPSQAINVTNTGGAVQFNVGTTASPSGWLAVDTTTATTPKTVNVSVNTSGLAAGTYNGMVTITPAGATNAAQSVKVTLTVTAVQPPVAVTVTSNASNAAGVIAPGELITLKGTNLSPASPPNGGLFSLNAQGGVNSTLDGVQVLFGGVPGTPIYVSPTQINVTVPWEIAGQLTTSIIVVNNGTLSTPLSVQVTSTVAPSFYTANSTGSGQAAAINQDGSFNGPTGTAGSKPASANTVISLYGTGGGVTSPGGTTGSVSPSNQLLRINGPVSATIGGAPATVEFIGAAPGLVTGVIQVNLLVPAGVTGNNLPVLLTLDGVTSPVGPTVAVQ